MLKYVLIDTSLFAEDEDQRTRVLGRMADGMEKLVEVDLRIIQQRREAGRLVPKLAEADVRYGMISGDDRLHSIEHVLETGSADVDSLCAWRAAELRALGIHATVEIFTYEKEWGHGYSCRVRLPDGTVDGVVDVLLWRKP